MLRIVVLPQPEWPITQTNSPRSIVKETCSKTARSPYDLPSSRTSRKSGFDIRDGALQRAESEVERHADNSDHEDRGDHVGEREAVPLVPHEVADAEVADQHLGRHDHQPRDAHR